MDTRDTGVVVFFVSSPSFSLFPLLSFFFLDCITCTWFESLFLSPLPLSLSPPFMGSSRLISLAAVNFVSFYFLACAWMFWTISNRQRDATDVTSKISNCIDRTGEEKAMITSWRPRTIHPRRVHCTQSRNRFSRIRSSSIVHLTQETTLNECPIHTRYFSGDWQGLQFDVISTLRDLSPRLWFLNMHVVNHDYSSWQRQFQRVEG